MNTALRRISHLLKRNADIHCPHCRYLSVFTKSPGNEWNKAFSEAEKIVGYPTSFLSLRCLLSDELSNVAMHMRKLVGTKHPLLQTAKGFVFDGKNSLQMRGLIVLLMSKAAGPGSMDSTELDPATGILQSQRSLAEITEMIHTANLIHRGVVNLSNLQPADGSAKDMEFGNKMAVLSGDFLLANASTGLAELRNTKVVEIMSSAIADLIQAEFVSSKDQNGLPKVSVSMTLDGWYDEKFLESGSLIAKSCQAALLLTDHSHDQQTQARAYGENVAVALRLSDELQPFFNDDYDTNQLSPTSIASVLHLSEYGDAFVKEITADNSQVDTKKLYNILKSSTAIDKARTLCQEHVQKAIDSIKNFNDTEAKTALEKIANAVIYS